MEIQCSESQNSIAEKSSQTYSLFNTDGILLNIEYELLIWYLKKDPRFDIVKKALLHLLPYIADITIDENDTPIYIEKETATPGGVYKPLPFSKLAAGHKSIIAMVGDIMIRFFKQQGAVEPKDLGGIVIIDELDLHLHPKWQRKLPALLSEVFPKIQFIASTHSVIPFLGAPEKSVFLKVNRNTEDGIKIETVDIIDIKNLLPNSILTSPIFDLEGEEIMHIDNQSIDDVNTEDNYKDIVEKKEIIKRMKAFKEKDMDFPDELFQPGPGEPGAR
ncbi:MAG: AAA family ATPase [bacterium]|nr:AAA family ATPase [bacterium]